MRPYPISVPTVEHAERPFASALSTRSALTPPRPSSKSAGRYPTGKLNPKPMRIGEAMSDWVPLAPPPGPPPFVMFYCKKDEPHCEEVTERERIEWCTPQSYKLDWMRTNCPATCCQALCQPDRAPEEECLALKDAGSCEKPEEDTDLKTTEYEIVCKKIGGVTGECLEWGQGDEIEVGCADIKRDEFELLCPGASDYKTEKEKIQESMSGAVLTGSEREAMKEALAAAEEKDAEMEKRRKFIAENCQATCEATTRKFEKTSRDCGHTCFCDGKPIPPMEAEDGDSDAVDPALYETDANKHKIALHRRFKIDPRKTKRFPGLHAGRPTTPKQRGEKPRTKEMEPAEFMSFVTRRGETPKRHTPIKAIKNGVKKYQPTLDQWRQATQSYDDPTEELAAHLKSKHVQVRLKNAGLALLLVDTLLKTAL